jgi:hypothetical protein
MDGRPTPPPAGGASTHANPLSGEEPGALPIARSAAEPGGAVTLANVGAGRATVWWNASGIPATQVPPPVDRGLRIRRAVLDRQGQPLDSRAPLAGELLVIRLDLANEGPPRTHVVLEALLPSDPATWTALDRRREHRFRVAQQIKAVLACHGEPLANGGSHGPGCGPRDRGSVQACGNYPILGHPLGGSSGSSQSDDRPGGRDSRSAAWMASARAEGAMVDFLGQTRAQTDPRWAGIEGR